MQESRLFTNVASCNVQYMLGELHCNGRTETTKCTSAAVKKPGLVTINITLHEIYAVDSQFRNNLVERA